MKEPNANMSELERLRSEAIRLLRKDRPSRPPLLFHLKPLVDWFEARHIELIKSESFPDLRQAFNPVFIHLPADGCRLTELASRANMSKQAMAELVDELVEKGYLKRFADPVDGRAKIIVRDEKGLEAHKATMRAFERIDTELEAILGRETLDRLRTGLARACRAIAAPENGT